MPPTLEFVEQLSPLHQRLFARDLWDVLARYAIDPGDEHLRAVVELVEAWEPTAMLDANPELVEHIRAPKLCGAL